jgi:hypothetical protein
MSQQAHTGISRQQTNGSSQSHKREVVAFEEEVENGEHSEDPENYGFTLESRPLPISYAPHTSSRMLNGL